jgi:hypothetical protein
VLLSSPLRGFSHSLDSLLAAYCPLKVSGRCNPLNFNDRILIADRGIKGLLYCSDCAEFTL